MESGEEKDRSQEDSPELKKLIEEAKKTELVKDGNITSEGESLILFIIHMMHSEYKIEARKKAQRERAELISDPPSSKYWELVKASFQMREEDLKECRKRALNLLEIDEKIYAKYESSPNFQCEEEKAKEVVKDMSIEKVDVSKYNDKKDQLMKDIEKCMSKANSIIQSSSKSYPDIFKHLLEYGELLELMYVADSLYPTYNLTEDEFSCVCLKLG